MSSSGPLDPTDENEQAGAAAEATDAGAAADHGANGTHSASGTHDPNGAGEQKDSFLRVIIHSFFIIPFLIAVAAMLVFVAIQIVTSEPQDVYDYLADVRTGGENRRWKAAASLAQLLGAGEAPEEPRFVNEMVAAFEAADWDDPRVRQFLAMAMASAGEPAFIAPMVAAIEEAGEDTQHTLLLALGSFRADDGSALDAVGDALLPYLDHPSARLRAGAVTGLGLSGLGTLADRIEPMLYDAHPSVTWDAAFALARLGDLRGKGILLNLLDRAYLTKFDDIDDLEQNLVMISVIQVAEGLADEELESRVRELSRNDGSLEVRRIAQQVLAD